MYIFVTLSAQKKKKKEILILVQQFHKSASLKIGMHVTSTQDRDNW